MAKASLAHEVADANRCRSVVTESLGFCLVVGDAAEVVREAGDEARLLPVPRDQETRVREALEAMLPHVATKTTTLSNHEGWVAGQAAADLALLDGRSRITQRR